MKVAISYEYKRPGGLSPQFLANILLKFVAVGSDKFTLEEHGFDGFGVWIEIIKSRVNQAGQKVYLVYDKMRGIDSLRSTLAYAKEMGLTSGNKNKTYFLSHKDKPFSMITVHEDFAADRELYKIMYDNVIPLLSKRLSGITAEEMNIVEDEMNY